MRFRLTPTPAHEQALVEHCAHARYVRNLAVERHQHWRQGRVSAPSYAEQSRQLTEARKEFGWLAAGSQTVQQQALRDFAQAIEVKSFRITQDGAGRWHVAFAIIPPSINGPETGEVVGVDHGVAVSAALSSGELLSVPGLREVEAKRLKRLQRRLARAQPGSNRRQRVKSAIGRLKAREVDRRKDWVEQTSTDLARRFDVIRVEDLKVTNMVRSARGTVEAPDVGVRAKAGLNRSIHAAGWGRLVTRLEDKAPGRVERVDPVFTSQICHACGHCEAKNRESQAVFRCRACGHCDQADVNAAKNIAAGRAVTYLPRPTDPDRPPVRGALQPLGGAVNREPQPALTSA